MLTNSINCIEERTDPRAADASGGALTIRCYVYPSVTTSPRPILKLDRKLAFEAMTLLMRLDRELREARADWNQDRFRRLMRMRPRVVDRLRRRWEILHPRPSIPLGTLRRRYHANLAGHLHE
jgi:hypothetical protein